MPEKDNKIVKRDIKRILCASSLSVLLLVSVMVFSPLAMQFEEDDLTRGGDSEWELDSLMQTKEYQGALHWVDSIIENKSSDLPRFTYFDRFLSEQRRYEVGVLRAEIYDLQWKRIEILQAKNDDGELKTALSDYCGIIGYNQKRAKALLNQLKDR